MSAAFFMTRSSISPPAAIHPEPPSDLRRNWGRVFTPKVVADWMTTWACTHGPRRILEPAAGDGVFIRSLDEQQARRSGGPPPRVDAFEIDPVLLDLCRRTACSIHLACRCENFLTAGRLGPYDAVVANPPYVKHHRHAVGPAVFMEFDRLCGRRISRMTNLYCLFLLRIWSLLAPRGRAAVITPAEWLNADFGVPVKAFLLEQNALDAVVYFDPAARIFPDALTTAAIILLRRGRRQDEPLRLVRAESADRLHNLCLERVPGVSRDRLSAERKWSPYFEVATSKSFSCEIAGPVLGDVASCSRGIATGANSYFVLRDSERRRWGISLKDVAPCISTARQITTPVLTAADVRRLIDRDERVFLLRPRVRLSPALVRYLGLGRRLGVDRRYLPSHRPIWFRPESRPPAPILIAVFSRGTFRVTLNRAAALNLTAYHGIYPREESQRAVAALAKYLQSDRGQAALALHRRVYGGGLFKLEPRDVEAIAVPPDLGAAE